MPKTATKPKCPRCEKVETDYVHPSGDEVKVCDDCREQARNSTSYLAVALYCWGRGVDAETAKKECRRASGYPRRKFAGVVYRIDGDDKPSVDSMGGMRYFGKMTQVEDHRFG